MHNNREYLANPSAPRLTAQRAAIRLRAEKKSIAQKLLALFRPSNDSYILPFDEREKVDNRLIDCNQDIKWIKEVLAMTDLPPFIERGYKDHVAFVVARKALMHKLMRGEPIGESSANDVWLCLDPALIELCDITKEAIDIAVKHSMYEWTQEKLITRKTD